MGNKSKVHEVEVIQMDEDALDLQVDGELYRIRWELSSQKLVQATLQERQYIKVSPGGYGLHWPMIDEDLAITPLLVKAEKLNTTPIVSAVAG